MSNYLKNRPGAATVEFAIIVVLLITLVFGIIEFGLIMKDYLTLGQAAREGVRSASLGSTTSVITTRIQSSALSLPSSSITITLYKRTMGSTPGNWTSLGNKSNPAGNDASQGDQVRVHLSYPHRLITGNLLTFLAGGGDSITLGSDMVMRRE